MKENPNNAGYKKRGIAGKLIIGGSIFLTAVHAANRLTGILADFHLSRRKTDNHNFFSYECRYGTVRYMKTGHGAPLLLLHGLNGSPGMAEWNKNIESLSKTYTVYVIEFIGYGYSSKPKLSYSAYLFASLVNDFIRDVIKEPTFAAASGAAGGVCLAASILQPKYFNKIMLISPTGAGTMKLSAKAGIKNLFEIPVLGTAFYNVMNSKTVTKYLLKNVYFNSTTPVTDFLNEHYLGTHYDPAGAKYSYAAAISNYLTVDLENMIKKAVCPIHIIWGDSDIINPLSNINDLSISSDESGISVTVFEGSRQYPHYENPKAFLKVCRWYFK